MGPDCHVPRPPTRHIHLLHQGVRTPLIAVIGMMGESRDNERRGRGGRDSVHFDKSIYQGKGTGQTDIITHLSCNCGESNTHSSYRQCLVSIRASTTYFMALTLFNTGAYTSFVNREVAKWLERQRDNSKTDAD